MCFLAYNSQISRSRAASSSSSPARAAWSSLSRWESLLRSGPSARRCQMSPDGHRGWDGARTRCAPARCTGGHGASGAGDGWGGMLIPGTQRVNEGAGWHFSTARGQGAPHQHPCMRSGLPLSPTEGDNHRLKDLTPLFAADQVERPVSSYSQI